jgi:hypothetical protein
MPDSNICVSNKLLGIQHPYSYCVKPSNEMVPDDVTTGGWSMENTGKVLGGILKYVDYLTINADAATAQSCTKVYTGKGVIGNRYVLKTNIKCRKLTASGVSGEEYLHKYIDNTSTIGGLITGGRPMPDVTGLVPSVFASAGKIGENVLDVISAFSADSKPYCMAVKLKCHVIDKDNKENSYAGASPDVYLTLEDVDDIDKSLFDEEKKPPKPSIPTETTTTGTTTTGTTTTGTTTTGTTTTGTTTTGTTTTGTTTTRTTTTSSAFTNLVNNIIYQNTDKIQGSTDFESVMNKINFQDEFLVKTYYVAFSILIIILIFKLINKK